MGERYEWSKGVFISVDFYIIHGFLSRGVQQQHQMRDESLYLSNVTFCDLLTTYHRRHVDDIDDEYQTAKDGEKMGKDMGGQVEFLSMWIFTLPMEFCPGVYILLVARLNA